MTPPRRRPHLTAPVLRAVALILFASLWAQSAALHITTHYANRTCEQPLQDILTVSTSTYTTTSEKMVGGALVQETQTVTITNNNVTETLMLWKYFSHDLVDVDPTSASTLHNDATAAAMCSYSGSLTKLRKVLESIITDCGYEVLSSGAHIFQALYRIETECSVNSDGKHCVTPKDFFARPYHNSVAKVETEIPEAGTSIVTTVTTVTDHPLTWGTADLMVQACPGSCPESGDKNRTGYCLDEDLNPPPSKGDCCMKVMWDYGIKYLGLGPEAECEMFRNLGNDCIVEPPISQEIDVALGGEAKLRSGAGVTVPAGAISADQCASPCAVSVEVAKQASSNLILAAVKKDNVLWTKVRIRTQILDFGPDGLKFSTPVTACLKAAAEGITNVSDIKVYQFNLTDGSTIGTPIVPDSFNTASKLVCFKTSSFSSYGGLSYQELSENSVDAERPANNNVQYILGELDVKFVWMLCQDQNVDCFLSCTQAQYLARWAASAAYCCAGMSRRNASKTSCTSRVPRAASPAACLLHRQSKSFLSGATHT